MKPMLTKEQFAILKPYEPHFETAKCDYVRGLYNRDVMVLQPIYNQLGFHLESPSCPACVLSMMKVLSQYFYSYKNRYCNNGKKLKTKESE